MSAIVDAELSAMSTLIEVLTPLDPEERERVLTWARERFITQPRGVRMIEMMQKLATEIEESRTKPTGATP